MSDPSTELPLITDKERVRRLLALPGVRPDRLDRLRSARVAIVGIGGLGNASAQYLAAQGVGHLTLIDGDRVDASNLGRQVLFGPADIGSFKVTAASKALLRLAPNCEVNALPVYLAEHNGASLIGSHDLILDGLDSALPRQWINQWALTNGVPVIFAGAVGYEAQVLGVYGKPPCLSCLWPSLDGVDVDCVTNGILGPLVGMIGSLQAAQAINHLIGLADRPGTLWTFDLFQGRSRVVSVPPNPSCPVCGPTGKEISL